MNTDPRVQAAAKAVYEFDPEPQDLGWENESQEFRDSFLSATAAGIAAADKAATITTVEELDALPELTVLIDSDPDVIEKHGDRWRSMNESGELYPSIKIGLPARVIQWGTE